ncbi:MAG: metallophosphoesterase family protein [Desulfurococcaceae archaeon]
MRILIISDIHGNMDALRAILDNAEKYDYLWVLGDLVDYGPEPHLVIDAVREMKPDLVIMGNHDYAVAYNTDCKCAVEMHELSVYTRFNISYRLLTSSQVNWLKTLRHVAKIEDSNRRIYIVHGAPANPLYGYLKPNQPLSRIEEMLTEPSSPYSLKRKLVEADYVIVGHTHIPMKLEVKGIKVCNPGSVGQPRDGDPRASYAILDTEKGEFTVHRVKYNVERVVEKLKELKVDTAVLKKLETILMKGIQ